MKLEFLSFNELKAKLCVLYKRDVDNAEITRFIMENEIRLFNIAKGFCVGEYVKNAGKKAIRRIYKDIDYVEIFESNELYSLMLGDLDRLPIDRCKSLYGKEIDCDGFIFLPKDIYERLIHRHPEKEALTFPCWLADIKQYYDQSEIELLITCNSLCISGIALEAVIDGTLSSSKEYFDDCAKLKGIHKTNRDARDRRGMARILAKYIEGKMDDKNYKLIDVANEIIKIMESFNLETIPKVDQIKGFIRNEVDPCATNPGTNKRKAIK